MTDTLQSMTGFGRSDGAEGGLRWTWEIRSVNGRGLDLRVRLPAGFDAIEAALREAAGNQLRRGTVSATLGVRREDAAGLQPDPAALDRVLALATDLAARIPGAPPPRAEALLALPGVLRAAAATTEDGATEPQLAAIRTGFAAALAALAAARQSEGARLHRVLDAQVTAIAALCGAAHEAAADQPGLQQARLRDAVRALLHDTASLPEDRIAQEVALLATRSDVREELDRLRSHVEAARSLLAEGGPVGRRLDFLVQEFVREANTLCAKSASIPLTATGLRLKAAIEQLREQVQNIE